MPTISSTVGRAGANFPADVLIVQRLINAKIPIPLALLSEDGKCGEKTIFAISEYQRRNLGMNPADGRVDPGGATFNSLAGISAAQTSKSTPTGHEHLYTNNPNEVNTTRTTPGVVELVHSLQAYWSELTPQGARTLTSQYMGETSGGKNCYNWNLGNVKSGPDRPHMYLHGVWEDVSTDAAQGVVDKAGGLASIASEEDCRKHGWSHKASQSVVVFQPPHPQCRFRAYFSLQEGAQQWILRYKTMAARNPNFLTALNSGDTATVAHLLKLARYYSNTEESYAKSMASYKSSIDKQLGPVT